MPLPALTSPHTVAHLVAALLAASLLAQEPEAEIAHRRGRLRVDGNAADWSAAATRFELRRPVATGEEPARLAVRLAWDRRTLWALFEVDDATLHLAPPGVSGAELFQWDSVELYLDGHGDRGPRMGTDDFQIILAPDGRYAVLQGDPLLLELEALEVPKRERKSIALEAAGERRADGYVVECALPLALVGVEPRAGVELAFDLGLNDWVGDHPPLRQLVFDLATLRKLDRRPTAPAPAYTRNGLDAEVAADLERRLYRPWSLAGSADFGHPRAWRRLRLTGGPAFADQVVDRLGPEATLAGGALSTLVLLAAVVSAVEWRHRRRIASLLDRLTGLEGSEPPAAAPAAPEPPRGRAVPAEPALPDRIEWLEHAAERSASVEHAERLELRALRTIRGRLAEALTPAELARALCVSLRTLQRHLDGALDCSPGELILAVKMREAHRLLELGALQVQEVARRVGYDDPAHFSRRFKAYFGVAPAALPRAAAHDAGPRRSVA